MCLPLKNCQRENGKTWLSTTIAHCHHQKKKKESHISVSASCIGRTEVRNLERGLGLTCIPVSLHNTRPSYSNFMCFPQGFIHMFTLTDIIYTQTFIYFQFHLSDSSPFILVSTIWTTCILQKGRDCLT